MQEFIRYSSHRRDDDTIDLTIENVDENGRATETIAKVNLPVPILRAIIDPAVRIGCTLTQHDKPRSLPRVVKVNE
jgi:hypothetical protein